MGSGDFNVKLWVANAVANLLVGSSGGKHGKGAGKNSFAACCKPCRNAYHVALGNAAVKKSGGEFFFKNARFCGSGKIRIQNNHIRIGFSKLNQSLAIAVTGCNFG
jgi:hypothetical protein